MEEEKKSEALERKRLESQVEKMEKEKKSEAMARKRLESQVAELTTLGEERKTVSILDCEICFTFTRSKESSLISDIISRLPLGLLLKEIF